MDPLVGLTMSSISGSSAKGDRVGGQTWASSLSTLDHRATQLPAAPPLPLPAPLRRPKSLSRPDNSPGEHQVSGWREAWKGVGDQSLRGQEQLRLSQGPAPGPSWAPSLGVGCEGRPPGAGAGRRNQTPRAQRRRPREVQAAAYSAGQPSGPCPPQTPLAAHLVDSLQSHGGKRWRRPPGRGRGRDGEGARGA